jgi:hypothetical protein
MTNISKIIVWQLKIFIADNPKLKITLAIFSFYRTRFTGRF